MFRPNGNMATVDIIIVVISTENCIIPTSLLGEIYEEAKIKIKGNEHISFSFMKNITYQIQKVCCV